MRQQRTGLLPRWSVMNPPYVHCVQFTHFTHLTHFFFAA